MSSIDPAQAAQIAAAITLATNASLATTDLASSLAALEASTQAETAASQTAVSLVNSMVDAFYLGAVPPGQAIGTTVAAVVPTDISNAGQVAYDGVYICPSDGVYRLSATVSLDPACPAGTTVSVAVGPASGPPSTRTTLTTSTPTTLIFLDAALYPASTKLYLWLSASAATKAVSGTLLIERIA